MKSAHNCYAGKILRIDLTSGSINSEALDGDLVEPLIGGRGIASKILYDEVPPEIDPFDPENLLIFAPGALHGTGVPAASRTTLTCRSPLTRMHGDGHSGAQWGGELKRAGYDVLVIKGRAQKPVTLFIDDDRVEIADADRLWGCLLYTSPSPRDLN